jgi:hypothetical protein
MAKSRPGNSSNPKMYLQINYCIMVIKSGYYFKNVGKEEAMKKV